jgi:hypothetical protein
MLLVSREIEDGTKRPARREDVIAFGNKTTTGVVGIAWLFPALDAAGYSDTALEILLNDGYPSLGHMAHQNMTTLCENWACTFHEAGGGSQNHIMASGHSSAFSLSHPTHRQQSLSLSPSLSLSLSLSLCVCLSVCLVCPACLTLALTGPQLGGWDAWLLESVGGLSSRVNSTTGGWRHVIARVAPAAITTLRASNYSKVTRCAPGSLVIGRFDRDFPVQRLCLARH